MTETTKTILIVGGLALAGFLAYKLIEARKTATTRGAPSSSSPGAASNVPPNSNTLGNWWDSLRTDFTGAVDSVEAQYKSLGQIF